MQGHHKFGNDLWKNKWCKFEMDAVEYYEGSQMKPKFTVKGKFLKNALVFGRSYTGIIFFQVLLRLSCFVYVMKNE